MLAFAAGSVAAERCVGADPRRWRTAVGALALNGLIPLAAVAPVAPIDVYAAAFHDLNDELGEQAGWPELVDQAARVATVLPADEQLGVRVVTASYGEAAAIDLYGPARGLPRGTALSGHNSYAHWWPDGSPPGAASSCAIRGRRSSATATPSGRSQSCPTRGTSPTRLPAPPCSCATASG